MKLDTIIVGGGIAGLQAAVQLGRYSGHEVLVIDSGAGRSSICRNYHNILGWPEGISGEELRKIGRAQAEALGVHFKSGHITRAAKSPYGFEIFDKQGEHYEARTLLLATGLMDRYPDIPGLVPTLGRTVYVCPDCDGYEIQSRKTVMLGAGNTGADMAILLCDRPSELIYINHENTEVDEQKTAKMEQLGITHIKKSIQQIVEEDGHIEKVILDSGEEIIAERGFIAFGGNHVFSELAEQLGATLHHNRHVESDPRTKLTNVENLWIAGDLGVHAEQVAVAMGEGVMAAISIHKKLLFINKQEKQEVEN
ncbi:thioredoxin reductase [Paenibacillus shirakamiensis]|uniref:Thioredoxin reductase n=1 Tax=Paenibacillus shirakamiensis TaxID=1265935 RepID=A0ABS4JGT2_9BACL|nr:NAD(P)/FAD-dependent oxidoreductase [Paenibacillus shirakamiensis]MBP2000922.1 thioredoxin reductase [Paenibacillus shirakamiensis]